jgi:hypothetical protein
VQGGASIYLIPIDDVTTAQRATLRVDPPINGQRTTDNGQRKTVRLAAAYEIARIDVF